MRLLLLPISTRRTLIYCEPLSHSLPPSQQSYLDRAVNYANKTWSTWEKAEGGWKLKTTQYGNQIFRRIPYEEWGLKSIPPMRSKVGSRQGGKGKDGPDKELVEVLYPPEFQALSKKSVLESLEALATERQVLHRKRMIWSIVGMPITAPFGLLPIVPNIPFFYMAFRAYSHWRALSGSRHLEHLIKANKLKSTPLETLDSVYAAGLLHPSRASSRDSADPTPEQCKRVAELVRQQMAGGEVIAPQWSLSSSGSSQQGTTSKTPSQNKQTSSDTSKSEPSVASSDTSSSQSKADELPDDEEILLLQGWNGKLLAERMDLPSLEVEIERAVEQVEKALSSKGVGELKNEKRELERVREAYLARKKAEAMRQEQPEKAVK